MRFLSSKIFAMKIKATFLFLLYPLLASLQPKCDAISTGYIPINDLGTEISPLTGKMGGLYLNGSNDMPAEHLKAGLELSSQIQCLDISGNPDATNGKIVWLSIGMSNCTQETQQFIRQANASPSKNPKLVLVDGAQGGQTANVISTPTHNNYLTFWNTVNTRLANAGVGKNQVQVIWFKEANPAGSTPPGVHYDSLVVQFRRCMNEIKTRFPNVKLCYMASRNSGRYASSNLNPEPYAYLTGWAVKQTIEDQIMGLPQVAFKGSEAKSPWLSWGMYMWSDGDNPQKNNPDVFYTCPADFQNDGTHPSTLGAQKVGALLLKFFSNDKTASPWFLGSGCTTTVNSADQIISDLVKIYPNPGNGLFNLESDKEIESLELFNLYGLKLNYKITSAVKSTQIDLSDLKKGVYLLHVKCSNSSQTKKVVIQ